MLDNISDTTILDMIEEARANFISSRFDDAAKLYGLTVRNLEKQQYNIDAIYFSYARIVALNKSENTEQEIQTLLDLTEKCQKLALKRALDQQKEEKSPLEKTIFMNHAQKIMKQMGMEDERESMILSLVQFYRSLIEEQQIVMDTQELFQERIIEFSLEYDHPKLIEKEEKLRLAELLITSADDLTQSEKLHVDVIAANKNIRAAKIYREYSMNKDMKTHLQRALLCSKHGQFDKFGFVKIIRPPRAKDEDGKELDPDPDMSKDMIKSYMNILLKGISDQEKELIERSKQDR